MSISGWGNTGCGSLFISFSASVDSFELLNSAEQLTVNNIVIIIGPSISKDAYEIDHDLAIKFKGKFNFNNQYITKNGEKYYLDLKELNKHIALKYGIKKKNIFKTDFCTYKEKNLFYSYRRDEGKTGRMAALITRK